MNYFVTNFNFYCSNKENILVTEEENGETR